MSRASNATLDKTICGVPVTQAAFKRAICEALEQMDGRAGKVQDLVPLLGSEWDTSHGRRIITKTLINLAQAGKLKRDPEQRGVYTVSAGFKRTGVSVSDQIEQSVLDSIRKRGGMARARDILDDHGLRQHGDELREVKERAIRAQHSTEVDEDALSTVYDVRKTTEWTQVTKVMRESPLIRQDCLKRGWYNLPQAELNGMTLRGLYAGFMIEATLREFGVTSYRTIYDERDEFFGRIGSLFQDARKRRGWSRLEFSRRPRVHAALLSFSTHKRVKKVLDQFYNETTNGKIAEMVAAGVPQEEVAAYRMDRSNSREGHQTLIELLERFELGPEPLVEGGEPAGINIHLNAPVAFYEALSAELGIDPVAASRGLLIIDMSGEKVRPPNNAANYERRLDVQEARERRAAGLDDRGSHHGYEDDEEDPDPDGVGDD